MELPPTAAKKCAPTPKGEIISASRRTDVCRFLADRFTPAFHAGTITMRCPRSGTTRTVDLRPSAVSAVVWWSKDYRNWIRWYAEDGDFLRQYAHMFNFTVNPRDLALEPGIESPPAEIFDQLRFLAREFGPRTIIHRLDPITVYRGRDGAIRNNVAEADVEQIFAVLEECGVRESTVAFCYAVNRAVSARFRRAGLELIDPDEETKLRMLGEIKTIADRHQIVLRACCMGVREGLTQSGCCIDGKRIEEVYGIKLRRRAKDSGQRDTCKCTTSIDIGSYDLQCPHRCVYCYARPQEIEDAG